MISKEALEYLQVIAKKPENLKMDGGNFLITPNDMTTKEIKPAQPSPLVIGSLTGLIEYIKNADADLELWTSGKYLIHIVSYNQVDILSGLQASHMIRRKFISAQVDGNRYPFERFLPTESFIIAVMTNFEKTTDRDYLLDFVSNIKAHASREENDEGVSQAVTVKSGITTLAEATVPNPVALRPYVTFSEIANPNRAYVFRIRQPKTKEEPITCALFPIDSDVWKTETVNEIRDYFKGMKQDGIIDAIIIS